MNPAAVPIQIDITCRLGGEVICETPIRVYGNCTLNNAEIGAFSYIAPGCTLHQTRLGRYSSIGDGAKILSTHPTDQLTTSPFPYQLLFPPPFNAPPQVEFEVITKTSIGNDVWIGSGVRIKSGTTIGNGAVIGAGSVVTRDVAPYSVVGGVPARVIRQRFDEATIEQLTTLKWWQYNLVGMQLPWGNLTATLRDLMSQIKSGALLPYETERYAVFREGENIHARRLTSSNEG